MITLEASSISWTGRDRHLTRVRHGEGGACELPGVHFLAIPDETIGILKIDSDEICKILLHDELRGNIDMRTRGRERVDPTVGGVQEEAPRYLSK
jgi:hypothetical protein